MAGTEGTPRPANPDTTPEEESAIRGIVDSRKAAARNREALGVPSTGAATFESADDYWTAERRTYWGRTEANFRTVDLSINLEPFKTLGSLLYASIVDNSPVRLTITEAECALALQRLAYARACQQSRRAQVTAGNTLAVPLPRGIKLPLTIAEVFHLISNSMDGAISGHRYVYQPPAEADDSIKVWTAMSWKPWMTAMLRLKPYIQLVDFPGPEASPESRLPMVTVVEVDGARSVKKHQRLPLLRETFWS